MLPVLWTKRSEGVIKETVLVRTMVTATKWPEKLLLAHEQAGQSLWPRSEEVRAEAKLVVPRSWEQPTGAHLDVPGWPSRPWLCKNSEPKASTRYGSRASETIFSLHSLERNTQSLRPDTPLSSP
jgi:hypothetical protein